MKKINSKHQKILQIFLERGNLQSSDIHSMLVQAGEDISLVTIKRALSDMAGAGFLVENGSGRSTAYDISTIGRMLSDVDAREYCSVEPDKRYGMSGYNFDILSRMPVDIFTEDETDLLQSATAEYLARTKDISDTLQKKELERLVIELSWKSSKIEGNTYSLLDTEKLILENKEAEGHSREEAIMILNHKEAFAFIRQNVASFKNLTRKNLEELHSILVANLNVNTGLRTKPVGITGSKYLPLDNYHQISDAVNVLTSAVSNASNPYAKALIALLGIGYIQPFEDGNKRTSRLMANALLLAHSLSPLSYRSVDEVEYRDAVIVFYELNSIMPMKRIFIDQYQFAARNYSVK